jgi:hypothetical protein
VVYFLNYNYYVYLNLGIFDFLTKLINNNEEIMKNKTLDGRDFRKLKNIVSKSL